MYATDSTPPALAPAAHEETALPRDSQELLTFISGDEMYGMDIRCVQEIRSFEQPTRLFTAPADCLGVIHLRGTVVPVHDMRLKLGQAPVAPGAETVVIVVNLQQGAVGMVVDSVCEVITLHADQIQPPPSSYASQRTSHIQGLGQSQERLVVLLDAERLMARTPAQ